MTYKDPVGLQYPVDLLEQARQVVDPVEREARGDEVDGAVGEGQVGPVQVEHQLVDGHVLRIGGGPQKSLWRGRRIGHGGSLRNVEF